MAPSQAKWHVNRTGIILDFHHISLLMAWWRHQMETFSALLAICAGNSPVTGEFPAQRPGTPSFDVFFDLCLAKQLSKQGWGWWFETPSCPLWRHRNGMGLIYWSEQTIKSGIFHCGKHKCQAWLCVHHAAYAVSYRSSVIHLFNCTFIYLQLFDDHVLVYDI